VPVNPATSRTKCVSKRRGSTSLSYDFPLIVILTCCVIALLLIETGPVGERAVLYAIHNAFGEVVHSPFDSRFALDSARGGGRFDCDSSTGILGPASAQTRRAANVPPAQRDFTPHRQFQFLEDGRQAHAVHDPREDECRNDRREEPA